jgi:heme A synthase
MTTRRFPLFAWSVFGYSLLAILWGYFLRISESGDGCGTDWPLCHGTVIPREAHFSTLVEFSHRLSSGVVLLLVLAMAVWAFRAFPRGAPVRKAAGASLLFTVTESLFGAVLVVFGWVATDVSTGRILIRPLHVTNTFLLMAALALTAWWAWRGTPRIPALRPPLVRLLLPGFLGTLALAWTGAWTGLATTAFPATTLQEGMGQYLDPEHLLISLRLLHPLLAVAVVAVLLRIAFRLRGAAGRASDPTRGNAAVRPLATTVGGLAAIQLLAGPLTILLGNPAGARLGHLLLADLLWVALVLLGAAALEADGGEPQSMTKEVPESSARTNPARIREALRRSSTDTTSLGECM